MFEIVDGRRRTPEHGYTISSPCEPNGSSELIMDQGPLCYILKVTEIGPLVPKKNILKHFYHIWARKPSGQHYINTFSFPCT